jgi:hypothetical protein
MVEDNSRPDMPVITIDEFVETPEETEKREEERRRKHKNFDDMFNEKAKPLLLDPPSYTL